MPHSEYPDEIARAIALARLATILTAIALVLALVDAARLIP